jgi:uncharacterized protein (TIGR02145 family)
MKKQFTVTAILICLYAAAFAQGAEVCTGTAYTIANTVDATTGSTYRWTENGGIVSGAAAATYTVPNTKAAGVYTYVRQSKSSDCPDWQSSNEFTVTVFACSVTVGSETGATATFTDSRDGKVYNIVRMPDDKVWFAQNLNYTQDMTFNQYATQANGKVFTNNTNGGVQAIGSYWCPALSGSTYSGDPNTCNIYGALYTWETAMMVDGKYADESKTSSAWDESWVSGYYFSSGAPGTTSNAKKNNARGLVESSNNGGRGICPKGWYIPTDYDWANLLDKVEGNTTFTTSQTTTGWWGTDAGAKLKSTATYTSTDPDNGSWPDHVARGTNATGFGIMPAGTRAYSGVFQQKSTSAYLWSSCVFNAVLTWDRQFGWNNAQVQRYNPRRSYAFSVRCVKEEQ